MTGANDPDSDNDNDSEAVSYTFMELKDTARVNRACDRWALLDMARNYARKRRGNASASQAPRRDADGRAWWEG